MGGAEPWRMGYQRGMNNEREVVDVEAKSDSEPKAVLVETEGFQCMAYQDCRGKWRNFYSLELLPGKVEVVVSS
jgi:hypothetical protein